MSPRKPKPFKRAIAMAHALIAERVFPGDSVIDATLGNGHDALFLAGQVMPGGLLHGFDIQQPAVDATRVRLSASGYTENIHLHATCHSTISPEQFENIKAVTFNLGYLPGGDHEVTTQGKSTIDAIAGALQVLAPGGVVTLVVYTGHEAGREEAVQVETYLAELPQEQFEVARYGFLNQKNRPPYLLAVLRGG